MFTPRIGTNFPPTACTAHPGVSAGRCRPEAAVTGAVKIPDTLVLHPDELTRPGGFADTGEQIPASASTCCAAALCAGWMPTYPPHRSRRTRCVPSYLSCRATSPRPPERSSWLTESSAYAARPTSRCPHTSMKLAYVKDRSRERHCIQVIDESGVASPSHRDRCFGRSPELSDPDRPAQLLQSCPKLGAGAVSLRSHGAVVSDLQLSAIKSHSRQAASVVSQRMV